MKKKPPFRTKTKDSIVALAIVLSLISTVIPSGPTKAEGISIEDVVREADAGNYQAAHRFLETLARSGNSQAQGFLSYVLAIGEWHVPIDQKRAEALLQSAVEQGDGYANTAVARMNEPDANIQPGDLFIHSDDYLENYLAAAHVGNPHAQYTMAYATRYQKNYTESLEWFKKSAEAGLVFAKAKLIIIEDIERSSRIKDPARLIGMATTGFPEIYYHLANAYKREIGVRHDPSLALTYAKLANAFSGGKIEPDLNLYKSGLSEQEQSKAISRAEFLIFEWAENPNTHLGKVAKWCKSSEYWTVSCITNAPFADLECMIPYYKMGFKDPQEFPGYSKCRYMRRMFPNL